MIKKIIFIFPGFRHKTTGKSYKEMSRMLKKEGFAPITVKISWKGSDFYEMSKYFLEDYKKWLRRDSKNVYFLGFSYGAIIALIASTKLRVNGLILCSLSPYFKEDIKRKKVLDNYYSTGLNCSSLTKRIKAKQVHMLYGTKEARPLIVRVKSAFKSIPLRQKFLVPIKKVEHEIGNKRYLYQIRQTAAII